MHDFLAASEVAQRKHSKRARSDQGVAGPIETRSHAGTGRTPVSPKSRSKRLSCSWRPRFQKYYTDHQANFDEARVYSVLQYPRRPHGKRQPLDASAVKQRRRAAGARRSRRGLRPASAGSPTKNWGSSPAVGTKLKTRFAGPDLLRMRRKF